MLRLSANEEKELTFEVQIGGVSDFDKVESFFRIVFEGIEYGFPCKVTRDSIQVSLPPLNKVIAKRIREGDEVDIKLEVVVDGHYLLPWQDRAKLSNPLVIEAKIKDDGFVKNASFKTTLLTDEGGQTQGVIVKEKEEEVKPKQELSEDFVAQIASKLKDLLAPATKVKEQDESVPEKEKEEEEKVEVKTEQKEKAVSKTDIERLLSETIEKLNLIETKKTKKEKKPVTLNEFKKTLTKDDIYKYMHRAGTTNKKIQDIVYEQATSSARTAEPVEILRQVINVMKKKK
jgi:hypothetical protein